MEEKKLTDETIVKALIVASEGFAKLYNGNLYKDALVVIKRLQSENERLNDMEFTQEHCDLYKENEWLKAELKRELTEHEEFTKQAKAEIERLEASSKFIVTKGGRDFGKTAHFKINDYDRLKAENAELQKQVDELTTFKNEAISMSLYGKGRKDGEEVAVKDTAKEILQELWDETEPLNESYKWVRLRIKNIASRKGVEVE